MSVATNYELLTADFVKSFNFQFVIFNNRVAQKFVRRVVQRLLRGGSVRAGRELDLDVFPDVDGGDALVTHLFKRAFGRFCPAGPPRPSLE